MSHDKANEIFPLARSSLVKDDNLTMSTPSKAIVGSPPKPGFFKSLVKPKALQDRKRSSSLEENQVGSCENLFKTQGGAEQVWSKYKPREEHPLVAEELHGFSCEKAVVGKRETDC